MAAGAPELCGRENERFHTVFSLFLSLPSKTFFSLATAQLFHPSGLKGQSYRNTTHGFRLWWTGVWGSMSSFRAGPKTL